MTIRVAEQAATHICGITPPGVRDVASSGACPPVISAAMFQNQSDSDAKINLTYRLPPELLGSIFTFVAHISKSDLSWIPTISHVCSYWRQTALATPNLWTDIPFTNILWADEMILRSKSVPLNLTMSRNWDATEINIEAAEALLARLPELLPRTRVLSLRESGRWTKLLKYTMLLNTPAPLLESLDVSFSVRDNDGRNKIPYGLLLQIPRLKSLKLLGFAVPWQELAFENLQNLALASHATGVSLPFINDVISALSRMPQLRQICLSSRFRLGHSASHSSINDTVTLPHLHTLFIHGLLQDIFAILDRVTYPEDTFVWLKAFLPKRPREDYSEILQKMVLRARDGYKGPIRSLALRKSHITCWSHFTTGFTLSPKVEIQILPDPDEEYTKDLWKPFLLHRVSSLLVAGANLDRESWMMLGELPELKYLEVDQAEYRLLIGLFHGAPFPTSLPECYRSPPDESPKFKSLRRLTIKGWSFSSVDEAGHALIDVSIKCFAARKNVGLLLLDLTLENCTEIGDNQFAQLEKVVARVVWKGKPRS